MAKWPFTGDHPMERATRGGGGLNVNAGGGVTTGTVGSIPYSKPRSTGPDQPKHFNIGGTNHGCCGTQGKR